MSMKPNMSIAPGAVLAAIIFVFASLSSAFANNEPLKGRLIILTSFPDALFEPYKRAFQAKHPNLTIHVLNKKTSAAISYIQDKSSQQADLVWASAPDAFEMLKQSGHLRKLTGAGQPAAKRVAGYPLDDPDGYYKGFAVSGYGIMWNTEYLARYNLKTPVTWDDLANREYAGHLAITAPSRSGTTHLIVEIILQSKGWQDGWTLLLNMSGNLATVTARSFGVRDGIRAGRFGTGPVIDFFGFSSIATGKPIGFAYPAETVLLPANVAIVQDARNLPAAAAFIRFLTSVEGQRILFKPEISRLPVRPDVYKEAPDNFPNPFDGSIKTKGLIFDSNLSRQRYHLVNTLFDILITHRLTAAKAAWQSLRVAEAKLASLPDPELQTRLAKARELLTHVPVSSALSRQASLTGKFSRKKPGFALSERQTALETQWISDAQSRYAEARRIADDISSALASRHAETRLQ